MGTPYKAFILDSAVQKNLLLAAKLPNGFKLYDTLSPSSHSPLPSINGLGGVGFGDDDEIHYNHIHINSILPAE
ncbi:MAG: hypothetical protein IPJ84_18415 [Bdellovibrionales bacterium]|nr:hypothetical protein [Bdellovibrionales bacterium]